MHSIMIALGRRACICRVHLGRKIGLESLGSEAEESKEDLNIRTIKRTTVETHSAVQHSLVSRSVSL